MSDEIRPRPSPPNAQQTRFVFVKFDETEKVYVDKEHGCSCFVRVDYFVAHNTDLAKGHAQYTLGEIFEFTPGKRYQIEITELD